MIFVGFGAAWLMLWSQRAFGLRPLVLGLIAAAAVAIFGAALRQYQRNRGVHDAEADSPARQKANKIFYTVNITQWVAILVVGNVLANVGLGSWVLAAAMMIIGLHFFPLAKAFGNPKLNTTGAAFVVLAIVYPLLAPGGASNPVGCLGAGLILWLSSLRSLAAG